jgi:predicted ABC-type ATPase
VNPRAAKVLQESIKISQKTHKIRTEGNISTPTTLEHMKANKERRYKGSHLHLNNIVVVVTNNRIPCARVNLILVPI